MFFKWRKPRNKRKSIFYLLSLIPFIVYLLNANPNISTLLHKLDNIKKVEIVRVLDGDTLLVKDENNQEIKIRLYGIDAPELSQEGGQFVKSYMEELLPKSSRHTIHIIDVDRYKRSVALVKYNDQVTVQEILLDYGLAWYYPQYCKKAFCIEWEQKAVLAQKNKLGIWQNENITRPSDFRKSK